jgi:hypothetical protein
MVCYLQCFIRNFFSRAKTGFLYLWNVLSTLRLKLMYILYIFACYSSKNTVSVHCPDQSVNFFRVVIVVDRKNRTNNYTVRQSPEVVVLKPSGVCV